MATEMSNSIPGARITYLRPLRLAILFATVGEFFVFLIFGLMLSGPENWVIKLVWAVGVCGIGMGSTMGVFIDLLVVDRWNGARAILATCGLSTAILGVACNVLCWRLDLGFHYFGGTEHPLVFLASGIVGAAIGGAVLGSLLFTEAGQRGLDRYGL